MYNDKLVDMVFFCSAPVISKPKFKALSKIYSSGYVPLITSGSIEFGSTENGNSLVGSIFEKGSLVFSIDLFNVMAAALNTPFPL